MKYGKKLYANIISYSQYANVIMGINRNTAVASVVRKILNFPSPQKRKPSERNPYVSS